jgi:stage III sporulation protein AG
LKNYLEKLRKLKAIDCVIFILLGVLVLIIAVPTGTGSENSESLSDKQAVENAAGSDTVQEQLAAILTRIEGVGNVRVMITFSDEKQLSVEGVVVVAEGGDSPGVEEQIREVVMSLFSVEAHKVIVVKMSGQEE